MEHSTTFITYNRIFTPWLLEDTLHFLTLHKVWKRPGVSTKEDNGWKQGWSGDLWDLLYKNAPGGSLEHGVANIACHRAPTVVTISS